jgi:chaperonin cofactor prefoldin
MKSAAAPEPPERTPEPAPAPQLVDDRAPVAAAVGNPALDLLKQAHAQLVERKESIEADLARMADLTKELETVNTQIQALAKTLGVFEPRATS